jgi:hypothetical protein
LAEGVHRLLRVVADGLGFQVGKHGKLLARVPKRASIFCAPGVPATAASVKTQTRR